jgi:hypothetical protein
VLTQIVIGMVLALGLLGWALATGRPRRNRRAQRPVRAGSRSRGRSVRPARFQHTAWPLSVRARARKSRAAYGWTLRRVFARASTR